MPDVLISENIVGEAMNRLRQKYDAVFEPELWKNPERLRKIIPDFRALIARNQTLITRDVIEAATRLEVIGRSGVGMDNVDIDAATRAGIVIAYTPEQNTHSVAELTIGLIISLARKIPAADAHARQNGWERHRFMGIELMGKTLGIIGLGRIGSATAAKARALGMEIIACDPYIDPVGLRPMEVRASMRSFDEVLLQADFVSVHTPENEETRGMFGYREFCRMKPTAFFLNAARGGIVVEEDLARALQENRIAGAALEVRAKEPAEAGPFAEMENVILVPHIGAQTHEAQHRVVTAICRDVDAILQGEEAKYFVNFSRPRRLLA